MKGRILFCSELCLQGPKLCTIGSQKILIGMERGYINKPCQIELSAVMEMFSISLIQSGALAT